MTRTLVPLETLATYLDDYLRVGEIPDAPNALNGLQAENSGHVGRVVAAVDASLATIEGVGGEGTMPPALLLVHHGMFWEGHRPVTGRRYRKLRALLQRDLALYAAHLPLDVHPEVGNNIVLARRLGLADCTPFGDYHGLALGVAGAAPTGLRERDALVEVTARALGIAAETIRVVPGGPDRIDRIGVITGAGGSMIGDAKLAGCEVLITGEGPAHSYFDAIELGVTVLYAGHYATETVGVQALGAHLAQRFGLPWEFHDHPTGM
ncbi:MAG TPA: Nif3-like dinuclear metal center hexameric protein [Gemmatimonadales bacterium]|nr:Nif3-like dinuclear metal center hexameric protein [Gemmatimonadales bacterium]